MKRKRQDTPVPRDIFSCISLDDSEGLALLLSMKADVNVIADDMMTPLHHAALFRKTQAVAQLLTSQDLDIDAIIEDGDENHRNPYNLCSALDLAATRKDSWIVRQLLGARASITEKKEDMSTYEDMSTLELAVSSLEIVKLLLDAKASVNPPHDNHGSALHIATDDACAPPIVVKVLLDSKANMEVKNSSGETPLDIVHNFLQSTELLDPSDLPDYAAKLYWLQQAMQTRRAITFLMGLHARAGVRSPLAQLIRHRRNLFDPQVLRLILVMMGVNSKKIRIQFCIAFLMGFHPRAGGVEPLQEVPSVLQAISRHTLFKPEILKLPLQLGGAISSRGLS